MASPGESIWEIKLSDLRERLVAGGPTPGGVAVASVTASLGLGLLAMTLEVTSARKDFTGDRNRLTDLLAAARREAIAIGQFADEDIAVFETYLEALRLPHGDEQERSDRRNAMRASLRRAIEVPMAAARAAAAAIEICADTAPLVGRFVAADLGAAAAMLSNAVRTILLSVDYNAGQLSFDPVMQAEIVAQRREIESQARLRADWVIEKIGMDDWWRAG